MNWSSKGNIKTSHQSFKTLISPVKDKILLLLTTYLNLVRPHSNKLLYHFMYFLYYNNCYVHKCCQIDSDSTNNILDNGSLTPRIEKVSKTKL